MIGNKMYSERTHNIPVFRGCSFGCVYCSFKRLVQMNKKCPSCAEFKPHSHMEVLKRTAPSTQEGNFVTVGLSSDISFMDGGEFYQVLEYCHNHPFTTFLIQSKNPACFLTWQYVMPRNVILGTTIEGTYTVFQKQDYNLSNNPHEFIPYKKAGTGRFEYISEAPLPQDRYKAMLKLNCRKAVTIEPVMNFDLDILVKWIKDIAPEFVYIGYDNHHHKLPEPSLAKTKELIAKLRETGIEVRTKTLRPAWWEEE